MVAAIWVYQSAVLSSIITIISSPYNGLIIAHEKMSAFAYISILEVVLKLLIVYLLLCFSFDKLILYAVKGTLETSN
jgi:O-antigen/teichoic acid export membrane protein